jgi:N4-gp56 family major capsid protein
MRADTSVGSWTSVSQYSNVQAVYANEMGIYKGFRVIKNNALGPDADAGAGAVDAYPIIALGFNGLGKATSFETQMRFTGPFDDLGRLINVGWYGVWKYGIVEPDAVWVGYVASSMGANV